MSMARAGYGVMLVEASTEFRDRVRGEFIFPWGVVEAKALGIYDDIVGAGGHRVLWLDMYGGPKRIFHGDLVNDTGAGVSALTFYHPTPAEEPDRGSDEGRGYGDARDPGEGVGEAGRGPNGASRWGYLREGDLPDAGGGRMDGPRRPGRLVDFR